jgi:hypothetical protein
MTVLQMLPSLAFIQFAIGEFGRRPVTLPVMSKFCFAFVLLCYCAHSDRSFTFTGTRAIDETT